MNVEIRIKPQKRVKMDVGQTSSHFQHTGVSSTQSHRKHENNTQQKSENWLYHSEDFLQPAMGDQMQKF